MDRPIAPIAPATQHSLAESTLQSHFDSFARNERSEQELLRSLVSVCINEPHATWQALSLLDQYHRRGVLPTTFFRELKKELNAIAFGNAGTHVTVDGKTFARAQTAGTVKLGSTEYATASFATAGMAAANLDTALLGASAKPSTSTKTMMLDLDFSDDTEKTAGQHTEWLTQSSAAAPSTRLNAALPATSDATASLLTAKTQSNVAPLADVTAKRAGSTADQTAIIAKTLLEVVPAKTTKVAEVARTEVIAKPAPTHIDPTQVEAPSKSPSKWTPTISIPKPAPTKSAPTESTPEPTAFDSTPSIPVPSELHSELDLMSIAKALKQPPSDDVRLASKPASIAPKSVPPQPAPVFPPQIEASPQDNAQVRGSVHRVGTVLNERYVLVEPVTSGNISMVFKAFDQQRTALPELERYVAIKCPHANLQGDRRTVTAFQHEYAQSQTILHPNIAKIYDMYEGPGPCFIVMELLQGEPLDRLLERIAPRRLPLPRALAIIREIGLALAHAHDHGVVHGNLQSSNVTLTRNGDIRVSDFAQSAGWLPPDAPKAEPADDLYSLACIAHELLCGCVPDANATADRPSYAKHLSAKQWRALQKGLTEDRMQRAPPIKKWLAELDLRTAEIRLPALAVLETELAGHRSVNVRMPMLAAAALCGAIVVGGLALLLRDNFRSQPTTSAPPPIPAFTAPAPSNDPIAAAWATAAIATPSDATITAPANNDAKTAPAVIDTSQLPAVSFTADRYEVSEQENVARLVVQRSDPTSKRLLLRWFTIAGSAQPGVDYVGYQYASVQLLPGQKSAEISIPLIQGSKHERDVSFDVRISATGEALPGRAVVARVIVLPAM